MGNDGARSRSARRGESPTTWNTAVDHAHVGGGHQESGDRVEQEEVGSRSRETASLQALTGWEIGGGNGDASLASVSTLVAHHDDIGDAAEASVPRTGVVDGVGPEMGIG